MKSGDLLDKYGVLPLTLLQGAKTRFQFRDIAERYRIVRDEEIPILVPYGEQGKRYRRQTGRPGADRGSQAPYLHQRTVRAERTAQAVVHRRRSHVCVKELPLKEADAKKITDWMCNNFFDIRTFGAVMTTDVNAGQVRGPLQLTFSRSLDPVVPSEFAITRCAVTNDKDRDGERTIGRKFNVPYGLYRGYGFLNATLAKQTGFDEDDLALLKAALNEIFDMDRSAARGLMSPVGCIAFRHDKATGNARADELFDMVSAKLKPELAAACRPPRSRHEYTIELTGNPPDGITVEEWIPCALPRYNRDALRGCS